MIRKLRKKLIIVLMAILSMLLVVILVSLFFSAKGIYERRSNIAFDNPPPTDNTSDRSLIMAIPIAQVSSDTSGNYTVTQNQIHYVSNEELIQIAITLKTSGGSFGIESTYNFRYRIYEKPDGSTDFTFTDTYIERDSLNGQIWYSIIIGIGALALFIVVSVLLSRWMVKPVESAWEKQRQFVTDAAHELKTPLTVILSNTDMLIESGMVTDKKNRMRLDNIRAESKRMKALTETLLSLARADSMPAATVKQPVNLSFILTGATLMFEPTVFDLGRSISCEAPSNVTVMGDREKLRQLAIILIDNAIQYGAEKTPILVTLTVQNKKEALFSVVSEGSPLTAVECTKIFERFYRVDASRGQTTGFGLGLSIAQSIVKEHSGRIWAESDGKIHNTFYVKLPTHSAV